MSWANALKTAANTARMVAGALPPPGNLIAGIASVALKAGALFAEAGKDPLVEITRILSADPELKRVHSTWSSMLDAKFPASEPPPPPSPRPEIPPPPPDTDPSPWQVPPASDPYPDD